MSYAIGQRRPRETYPEPARGNGNAQVASNIVTFRPGGPAAPNVFPTLAAVAAATVPVVGYLKVVFDLSLVDFEVTIPTGSYAFGQAVLEFEGTVETAVTWDDGALVTRPTNTVTMITDLEMIFSGAWYVPTGITILDFSNTFVEATGANPAIHLTGSATLGINLTSSEFEISGAGVVVSMDSGPSFAMSAIDASTVVAGAVAGPGAAGSSINLDASSRAPSFPGSVTLIDANSQIEQDLIPLPQEPNLSFVGESAAGVVGPQWDIEDDPTNLRTTVQLQDLFDLISGTGGPFTLVGQQAVFVEGNSVTTVQLPAGDSGNLWDTLLVNVSEIVGTIASNITVKVSPDDVFTELEDPGNPGTYVTSVHLTGNGVGVTWMFSNEALRYKVFSAFDP